MDTKLKKQLVALADAYENEDFLREDPSFFLRWFKPQRDVEILALFAACMAYGRRDQFMFILDRLARFMDESAYEWVMADAHHTCFPYDYQTFYRFYTQEDVKQFFDIVKGILYKHETIGAFCESEWKKGVDPLTALIDRFQGCPMVPKSKASACKRLNLFLRWMVRDNSPVDVGLWTWYDKKNLIIPLDTHVLKMSVKMGLIEKGSSSMKTAIEITERLREIWPDDPCKGDFALFGYGVNLEKPEKKNKESHQ